MQNHRDGLKWNITDGHHKITLTLTWTFRKSSKETLWEKIQRTLRLRGDDTNGIPAELTKFLDSSPKRPLVMSKELKKSPTWHRTHAHRQSSLGSPTGSSNGLGRIRFSWPGASSPIAIRPPVHRQTSTPLPDAFYGSPNMLSRSDSSASAPSRVRLSYRTEEDIEHSLEDLMERTRAQTQEKLNAIREEWNRSMAECSSWPRRTQSADAPQVRRSLSTLTTPRSSIELLDGTSDTASTSTAFDARSGVAAVSGVMPTPISRDCSTDNTRASPSPHAAITSSTSTTTAPAGGGGGGGVGGGGAAAAAGKNGNIKNVNDTVQKCLSSCDKILYRHSTTIT